ncbi:MAG: hypothetical protein V3T73_04150 [Dehalococcoidales bacterium]
MGEIKSAHELAMEKVKKMGEATVEDRRRWKYTPEGEKLARRYINGEADLANELSHYEAEAKGYVAKGAEGVLLTNINLPRNNTAIKNSKKAMDGLEVIKNDKEAVASILGRIGHLFSHYIEQGEQQRKQAYESLKAQFSSKLEQAAREQMGSAAGVGPSNVENHPQFQEEWRKALAHMDLQYISNLDENKKALASLN